jgi:hypothetical protein
MFLLNGVPERPNIDRWAWTMVEDIPPAHFPLPDSNSSAEIFDSYIEAMEKWTESYRPGREGGRTGGARLSTFLGRLKGQMGRTVGYGS